MPTSSSVPHDRTYAYKATISSGFVASPPPVGDTTFYFLLFYFSSLSMSTVLPFSVIFGGDLPVPQRWPGIWRWWITVIFNSTLLLLLTLSSTFYCFHWIETGNESGIPSDVLSASLALCWNIISILNFYPRIPLTKTFSSVMIEALIFCRNGHEKCLACHPFS